MISDQHAPQDAREPSSAAPNVSSERSGRRVVVTLSGDFDADVEAGIWRTINRVVALRGLTELHVDTTRVTFMDSSGLRQLVLSSQLADDHGLELCIVVEQHGPVARLLELTGLLETLPIALV